MTSSADDRDQPRPPPALRVRPPLVVSAGTTTATFTWAGDRWRHAITIGGRMVAASVEGAADGGDAAWPASPPLVELSLSGTGCGPALLGVGLAGRSHFSASVAPHPDVADTLRFELAARIKDAAGWLGSTYEFDGRRIRIAAPAAASTPTICWTYAIGPAGFVVLAPATLLPGG